MGLVGESNKPHAVCFPLPFQGHVTPLLKFAKLLHHKGFHITFVNTEINHKRQLNSRGPNSMDGLPDFRFETIPDGLPPLEDDDATQDLVAVCESSQNNFLAPFRSLVAKLNDTVSSGVPPVSCIVADGGLTCTLEVSEELGIPNVHFWTLSASALMGYRQISELIHRGLVPLKDPSFLTNRYLDNTIINWIPGMKDIRLKDFPTAIRTTDPNDFMLNFTKGEVDRSFSKASAFIFNTFNALEKDVLDALSSTFPHVYAIGPLQLLLNSIQDDNLKSIGSNLWKEEQECIQWLNSKEPNSVVYVNFGSIVIMSPQQLLEFAWGLANSNHSFLWIIRHDLVAGEFAILPPEFTAEIKGRGLIANWCSQEQVLNHSSLRGFLTHCGWNSTLESICSGVPMVCWPFLGDQQMNCRYSCNEWGIGMEIDNDVKRDEVEKLVRDLMVGEKGKMMKNKVMEWKKMADKAAECGGSSFLNLDKLVNDVLLSKK